MAKRIKNNTGATITVLGQEILPAAYYTLDQFEATKAINELDTLIDAATIVINDGTADLSAALGKALINGFDAGAIGSVPVDTSNQGNGRQLQYNSATKKLEYVDTGSAAAGAKGQIQVRGNTAGSFTAFSELQWDDNRQALLIGLAPGTLGGLTDAKIKNRNSWVQTVVQNTNAGTQATADLVALADASTDDAGYVDVGINSSGYNDPLYPLSAAGDSYLYCDGGHLSVGTYTPTKDLILHAGGFELDKERIRCTAAALAKDALVKFGVTVRLVNDTTANRPTTPANGMLRYNTTTQRLEAYENGVWVNLNNVVRTTFSNANYTVLSSDRYVAQVGTMSAPRVVTLPLANTVIPGTEIIINDESGSVSSTNTLTITRAGADLIDGQTTVVIGAAYAMRRLFSDGASKWTWDGGVLRSSNNLSDIQSAATARTNLGAAPLDSPTFTGTPAAPTPASNDNSTKLATTAWVLGKNYANLIDSTFSDGTNPYISTVATTYAVISRFVYSGTADIGALTRILVIAWATSGGQCSIRIWDATNSLAICELTGITDNAPAIKNLGVISNLPAGQAVFEIQMKTNNATKTVYVSALQGKC